MDLKSTIRSLFLGWYYPALGVLVACGAAAFLHAREAPVYETNATYVLTPYTGPTDSDTTESVKTLDATRSRSILTTLTEIIGSETAQTEAAVSLGLDPTVLTSYEVAAVVAPEANVVAMTVRGPDPARTVDLSNAIGAAAVARFIDLYKIYDVVPLDPPVLPDVPSNRGLVELAIMASAFGLLVGGGVALVRGLGFDERRRSMEDRLEAYGGGTVTPLRERDRYQRVG
jgi:capsular polysaccharide biosynthesis protein